MTKDPQRPEVEGETETEASATDEATTDEATTIPAEASLTDGAEAGFTEGAEADETVEDSVTDDAHVEERAANEADVESADDESAEGPGADPVAESDSPPAVDASEDADEDRLADADTSPDRGPFWLVAATFLTALVVLLIVSSTRAWDPYACETNDDCRGQKECMERECVNPEVYQLRQGIVPSGSTDDPSGE